MSFNNTTTTTTTAPSSWTPAPRGPPIQCFTGISEESKQSTINYFLENLDAISEGYLEMKINLVSPITIILCVLFIFRHIATAESRSISIKNFLRSKGVENDNTSSTVLQPLSSISYNLAMLVFRLTLFFTLLFPSTPSPSPFPKDYFSPLFPSVQAENNGPIAASFPAKCIYEPGWYETKYACFADPCDPRDYADNANDHSIAPGKWAPGSEYAQGRGYGCKTCGYQFDLPVWYLEQFYGIPADEINQTSGTNSLNVTMQKGAYFYTTQHENPLFGPAVIVGVLGTILQVGLEWYWNKQHPEQRRKLRAVSTTILNYYDFLEHLQNPKAVFYKEYDWKYVIAGIIVQATTTFTPCIYLFASYATVCMISFWPIVFLTSMSIWDILWLMFILVERKTDDEDLKFGDFDPQLRLLKISRVGEEAAMLDYDPNIDTNAIINESRQSPSPSSPPPSASTALLSSEQEAEEEPKKEEEESLETEIKKIEHEETRLSQVQFGNDNNNTSNNNKNENNHQDTSKITNATTILPSEQQISTTTSTNRNDTPDRRFQDPGDLVLQNTKILHLPITLEELLPTTKPRSWKQSHEIMILLALTFFVPMALIKFIPGSAMTPSLTVLLTLPFIFVSLFWRTRNSFKLVVNDDGTLTFYLEKITSCGISILVDITHGILHRSCLVEFIHDLDYYEKNKIDRSEFLVANFFVDHLKYELYLHPGSESKILQQLEWLEIVVKNSHRDLYTSENTADVPRKQTADSRLSHLLTFVGRVTQSEDILQLALRLDPTSQIANASLHAMNFEKSDPGSLSFDRRRGDRIRLGLRVILWMDACYVAFFGLMMPSNDFGFETLERHTSGGGVYYCASKLVDADGVLVQTNNGNEVSDVQRFPVYLFPQILYVEIFVYVLLLFMHLDMIYRKRAVLESPIMIRLQAAGGILAALHWPASVAFMEFVLNNFLTEFAFNQHLLTLFIWYCQRLLVALICPLLGLIFPLVA